MRGPCTLLLFLIATVGIFASSALCASVLRATYVLPRDPQHRRHRLGELRGQREGDPHHYGYKYPTQAAKKAESEGQTSLVATQKTDQVPELSEAEAQPSETYYTSFQATTSRILASLPWQRNNGSEWENVVAMPMVYEALQMECSMLPQLWGCMAVCCGFYLCSKYYSTRLLTQTENLMGLVQSKLLWRLGSAEAGWQSVPTEKESSERSQRRRREKKARSRRRQRSERQRFIGYALTHLVSTSYATASPIFQQWTREYHDIGLWSATQFEGDRGAHSIPSFGQNTSFLSTEHTGRCDAGPGSCGVEHIQRANPYISPVGDDYGTMQ